MRPPRTRRTLTLNKERLRELHASELSMRIRGGDQAQTHRACTKTCDACDVGTETDPT